MIVTLEQLKEQLNFTDDMGSEDDALLIRLSKAAQNHVERLLGFKIEETFGGTDQDPIPDALVEGVSLLAAHWYENREAVLVGVSSQAIPIGLDAIVNEYRNYTYGVSDGE
ncbi:head-tail connector protein [Pelagibacterium halotolerans]|uniref:head-tail connector protein n=1 Tax=Pelagibacterium halotolerans TaxID=531813 RepID=UPI00384C5EAC